MCCGQRAGMALVRKHVKGVGGPDKISVAVESGPLISSDQLLTLTALGFFSSVSEAGLFPADAALVAEGLS